MVAVNRIKKILLTLMCASVVAACGCGTVGSSSSDIIDATSAVSYEELVRNNPQALASNYEAVDDEPFSSYTYDFSVYNDNFMITAATDEFGTGLTLTVEDNRFGFSAFSVTPPNGYMAVIPFSQQYANQVCTVIKSTDPESFPDLLKIDFCLATFEDESLPYTVSRLYSIVDNQLVEATVYDNVQSDNAYAGDYSDSVISDSEYDYYGQPVLDYIPDSNLIRTESRKFMVEPDIQVDENGEFSANIITYVVNFSDMSILRCCEPISVDNPLYFGYYTHAVANSIYRYFIATSLNVSDYDNYVEIPVPGRDYSDYFFKVDDPRFSTVAELEDYVSQYFAPDIVKKMFEEAPQKYRDIDGELYTILGDGGMDPTLGNLIITEYRVSDDGRTFTFSTEQEKYDENYVMTGCVDGGDFVIELTDDGFIVKEYRYPYL